MIALDQEKNKQDPARNHRKAPDQQQKNDAGEIKWTDKIVAAFTIVLAVVAAAQLSAAWLQAKWTRKAVEVARMSADAAIASAKAADRAATAARDTVGTERAWMSYVNVEGRAMKSGAIDGKPVTNALALLVIWKNTGRSPAIGCDAACDHRVVGLNDPVPRFDVPRSSNVRSTSIGPGMTVNTGIRGLDDDEYAALRAGSVKVCIYSRITYFDVFDKTQMRSTELCAQVIYGGEVADSLTQMRLPHIITGPVGPQNSAS